LCQVCLHQTQLTHWKSWSQQEERSGSAGATPTHHFILKKQFSLQPGQHTKSNLRSGRFDSSLCILHSERSQIAHAVARMQDFFDAGLRGSRTVSTGDEVSTVKLLPAALASSESSWPLMRAQKV
jgi:hypothetical protein